MEHFQWNYRISLQLTAESSVVPLQVTVFIPPCPSNTELVTLCQFRPAFRLLFLGLLSHKVIHLLFIKVLRALSM